MKLRGLIALAALLSLVASSVLPARGAASPLAQQPVADSGVSGNRYTSPDFGYSISWDSSWSVSQEDAKTGYNLLTLDNGTSTVYLEGVESTVDTDTCLQASVDALDGEDGVTNVEQATSEGSPLGGSEAGRSWAVYNLTYTGENNKPLDLTEYLDCRTIVEGTSNLVITQIVATEKFESEIDPLLALLGNLSISGSGSTSDNQGSDSTADETPASGGNIGDFITKSLSDIDSFWKREYPLISNGGTYVPPADLKNFDSAIDTGCGAISDSDVGQVGPFYCPADQTIYYDLAFAAFQVKQFGSRSVVSVALAHEIGHHIQELEGWKSCSEAPCLDPAEMTSQEIENQADCFAGAWTADAEGRGRLGSFDVETNIVQFAALLGDENASKQTADAGAHGNGAIRTYWFLGGYYKGATDCLTVSAATDPALNGEAAQATATPTTGDTGDLDNPGNADEPTATPDDEPATKVSDNGLIPETTVDLNAAFDVKVGRSGSASATITGTEVMDSVADGVEATGQYLVVYFTLETGAKAGVFDYTTFSLTDADGNVYQPDEAATDALLKTGVDNGMAEVLDPSTSYNLGVVYDVPADASGFTVVTSDAIGITLDK